MLFVRMLHFYPKQIIIMENMYNALYDVSVSNISKANKLSLVSIKIYEKTKRE